MFNLFFVAHAMRLGMSIMLLFLDYYSAVLTLAQQNSKLRITWNLINVLTSLLYVSLDTNTEILSFTEIDKRPSLEVIQRRGRKKSGDLAIFP